MSAQGQPDLREERLFIEHIGASMNHILGHPKGRFVYQGEKRALGHAMQVAGAQHLEPFTKPIELWYYPKVIRGKSGQISKRFDCLNFGISYKIIEDWLVKLGLVADDNREWVYAAHCMRCELASDGREGVEVVIREADCTASIGQQEPLMLLPEPAF